jgi:hypothetical protein
MTSRGLSPLRAPWIEERGDAKAARPEFTVRGRAAARSASRRDALQPQAPSALRQGRRKCDADALCKAGHRHGRMEFVAM